MTEDDFLKFISQIENEEKLFWEVEYPSKSREEKIKHWGASLYRSMRSQEEVGQNPYIIYKEILFLLLFKDNVLSISFFVFA